jgi:histone-lysine N-methyltransferase SETMAR
MDCPTDWSLVVIHVRQSGTYEDVLQTKFLPALRKKRRKKPANVLFHHDNAPPHRAARVYQFFDNNNFEVVRHAPYSPDLAPSDFWLFPTLKDTLRKRTFSSRSALATAIFQWSQRTPKEAFVAAMQSWRQRCEKCVRLQGDYFEKWLHFQLSRMSNFFFNKLGDLRT